MISKPGFEIMFEWSNTQRIFLFRSSGAREAPNLGIFILSLPILHLALDKYALKTISKFTNVTWFDNSHLCFLYYPSLQQLFKLTVLEEPTLIFYPKWRFAREPLVKNRKNDHLTQQTKYFTKKKPCGTCVTWFMSASSLKKLDWIHLNVQDF